MTLATQTLEVIGLRRKDADTVTVELGLVQEDTTPGGPMLMPYAAHVVDVADTAAPDLGTPVTLTFTVQP